jgi:hypothetical protein
MEWLIVWTVISFGYIILEIKGRVPKTRWWGWVLIMPAFAIVITITLIGIITEALWWVFEKARSLWMN